ncbi:Protein SOK2 [Nakaseomyces glabratus]|nr:Protein SOK2 [Nakaseomyces glabratus]KTB26631.1 Protein SOK2 [Nakaseomyces glabratus]
MSERELPGYTYLPPPRLSYQPSIALVPGVMQVRPPASPASPVATGAGTPGAAGTTGITGISSTTGTTGTGGTALGTVPTSALTNNNNNNNNNNNSGNVYMTSALASWNQYQYPWLQHPLLSRVITTYWEDEHTICHGVNHNGVTVVRRADNDMVNGTKLLNVTGMTRGRRDGILKNEPVRDVVKGGPMTLKGVWIPIDRARAIARQEGIEQWLYPLFIDDLHQAITLLRQQVQPQVQMPAPQLPVQSQQLIPQIHHHM